MLRKKLEEYLPVELSKEVTLLGDLREEQKSKKARERKIIAKRQAQKIIDLYFDN